MKRCKKKRCKKVNMCEGVKWRIVKMPLKLRDQFNITIYFMCIHIYIAIYINLSTISFWFMEYTHVKDI